jgi:hypothetical protein
MMISLRLLLCVLMSSVIITSSYKLMRAVTSAPVITHPSSYDGTHRSIRFSYNNLFRESIEKDKIAIDFKTVIDINPESKTPITSLGLLEPSMKTLARRGYELLTPVQSAVYEDVKSGMDLVVRSRTGTGNKNS